MFGHRPLAGVHGQALDVWAYERGVLSLFSAWSFARTVLQIQLGLIPLNSVIPRAIT